MKKHLLSAFLFSFVLIGTPALGEVSQINSSKTNEVALDSQKTNWCPLAWFCSAV